MNRTWVRELVRTAAIALVYFASAKLGLRMAFVAAHITTVWPPTGIALACAILWGSAAWPGIWIGALAANATITDTPLMTALLIASGNTGEAICGAYLLNKLTDFKPPLQRVRDVAALVFAAATGTMVSAAIGVASLCVSGLQPWRAFASLSAEWWLGDTIGALIVTPLILTWTQPGHRIDRRQVLEAVVLLLTLGVAAETVFAGWFDPATTKHPLEFVIFPFVIWAALRFGQLGTTTVITASAFLTITDTVSGRGPFAEGPVHENLILLQVFLGVIAVSGQMLAAAIAERRTVERRRAASYAVAEILAAAESFEAAAHRILAAICEHLDWDIGALWMLTDDETGLRCAEFWPPDRRRAPHFMQATRSTQFKPGVGLPGRVWTSGEPVWIRDVVVDPNFPRAPFAAQDGLHGAFAFPIQLGSSVLGVVECFSRYKQPPDADLLLTLSSIGSQMGQFIERKRVEEQRRELLAREQSARVEAETANRAKDEFLATLSHELRTPLNAILGWTRMLLDGTMDADADKARHALEIVDRNANAQFHLISDMLDVSRIIAGTLRLNLSEADLKDIVSAALDAVKPMTEAKEISIRASFDEKKCVIDADADRLQQVVWNLLSNAVKFSEPRTPVDVSVRDGNDGTIVLTVKDSGSGIAPEFIPFVFDRFRQADASLTREYGGLGLGLTIVRHIVELHGGTIEVHSEGPGRGAVFTVRLPARAGRAGAARSLRPQKIEVC